MGLLDQILVQGDNSLLYKELVKENGYTANVTGGINYLGNMFNYKGPMLWMFNFIHDNDVAADTLLQSIDGVISDLQASGVTQDMLDKARLSRFVPAYMITWAVSLGLEGQICFAALPCSMTIRTGSMR